jgi:hypothetical protein
MNYRIQRFVHQESGLTFFSAKERVVFARWDKKKEQLLPLKDDDIELCNEYGFRSNPEKWKDWRREIEEQMKDDE